MVQYPVSPEICLLCTLFHEATERDVVAEDRLALGFSTDNPQRAFAERRL